MINNRRTDTICLRCQLSSRRSQSRKKAIGRSHACSCLSAGSSQHRSSSRHLQNSCNTPEQPAHSGPSQTLPQSRLHELTRSQYVHPDPASRDGSSILSLLPSSPPDPNLAIGTATKVPPTPDSLTENHGFMRVMQSVIREHCTRDPQVISQAQAMASSGGSGLGSGGVFMPQQHNRRRKTYGGGGGAGGGGAGGASAQGGMGGGGVGGWVHVSDQRNPPDYGRIAWPEDIFGSVEVDGQGQFVGENGSYQESGTYRICTREGM